MREAPQVNKEDTELSQRAKMSYLPQIDPEPMADPPSE